MARADVSRSGVRLDRGIGRRRFLGLLGGAAAAWPVLARGQQSYQSPRLRGKTSIDVHIHPIGGQQRLFGEAIQRCLAGMQSFGVTKGALMSPPQAPPGIFDYTDFLPELRQYGNRFAFLGGGGTLNPMMHAHSNPASVTPKVRQDFIDAANRILDSGAVGFGEIAVLHLSLVPQHPFEQVLSSHPLLSALADVADQRKAVIDLHMDPVTAADGMPTPAALKVPPNPPTLAGNIAGFERLLTDHPGARIVWAHGGSDLTGNMTPTLIGRLLDAHPNLFMSLRPVPPQAVNNPFGLRFFNLILTPSGIAPEWLALLRRHSDRFVMGSDAFFVAPSANVQGAVASLSRGTDGRLAAANMMLAKLPPNLSPKIAADNPARIYRI